jgi:pimeloyl-ACP methyl ester carboxylesterase
MTQPSIKTVQCLSPAGLHTMAYKEWGDPQNPNVLICVHGVTRASDDFDDLAQALCDTYRVVCPDIVGRGRSDWLRMPQYYQLPQYTSDLVTLLARVSANTGTDKVDWFGTSMGGLIGIALAALQNSPIRKLLLNDIGPTLNFDALTRIGVYIGQPIRFATFDEAARYIRDISLSFGPHTDEQWHKLAKNVLRQDEEGFWGRHYDLRLANPFKAETIDSIEHAQTLLWVAYDAIRCPTLLIRGARSDLLSPDVAHKMTQRGPKAELVELTGIGHAPTFMHADQIMLAKNFFLQ